MNKKDRLNKLMKIYQRIQQWVQSRKGNVSPSDMNIAQAALREVEELTVWVDGQDQKFTNQHMRRLNNLWDKYKL